MKRNFKIDFNNTYVKSVSMLLLMIFMIAYSYYSFKDMRDKNKTFNSDYVDIQKCKTVKSKIVNIKTERGQSYLTLSNNDKVWIKHSRNYDYKPSWIDKTLTIGDSIFKEEFNDTLMIYRGNDFFIFVIGEFINE